MAFALLLETSSGAVKTKSEWRPLAAIVVKFLKDNLDYRFCEKLGSEELTVVQIWCGTWEKPVEYQDVFIFREEL